MQGLTPPTPRFSDVRTVSFDAFGTLVRFAQPRRPFGRMIGWLRQQGLVLPMDVREQVMRHPWSLNACAQALGASARMMEQAPWNVWQQGLHDEALGIRPFDDSLHVLQTLRERGYRLAIASNLAEPYVAMVEQALDHFAFDVHVWSCRVNAVKPQSRFFQRLTMPGRPPQQLLHVGDTWQDDVVGAQRAGAHAIFVNREGRELPCETDRNNVVIVQSLSDLLPLLSGR